MVNIREMAVEDYDIVYKLWLNIPSMAINDVDGLQCESLYEKGYVDINFTDNGKWLGI